MPRPKTQFGDWKFDDLLQRLVQVPRAEIDRRMKAEQKAKQKRKSRTSASGRASHAKD